MCQSVPEWNRSMKHPWRVVWPWHPGTDAEESRVILAVILTTLRKHSRVSSLFPLLCCHRGKWERLHADNKLRQTVIHIQNKLPKPTNNGLTTAMFQWHSLGYKFSVASQGHYSICFTQKFEGSPQAAEKIVTHQCMGEWEGGRHWAMGSVLGENPNPKGRAFRGLLSGALWCVHATAKVRQ